MLTEKASENESHRLQINLHCIESDAFDFSLLKPVWFLWMLNQYYFQIHWQHSVSTRRPGFQDLEMIKKGFNLIKISIT